MASEEKQIRDMTAEELVLTLNAIIVHLNVIPVVHTDKYGNKYTVTLQSQGE